MAFKFKILISVVAGFSISCAQTSVYTKVPKQQQNLSDAPAFINYAELSKTSWCKSCLFRQLTSEK